VRFSQIQKVRNLSVLLLNSLGSGSISGLSRNTQILRAYPTPRQTRQQRLESQSRRGITETVRRSIEECSLRDVTVCIAAKSNSLGAIVAVSDMMFSNDERSIEGASAKFASLVPGQWFCWFAGDPTVFAELRRRTCQKFEEAQTANLPDLLTAIEEAYTDTLKHRVERQVLSVCGLKYDEFFSTGIERLGEMIFQQLFQEIRFVDLGTELLIAGFDDDKTPHLFNFDKFGICTLHDVEAFHAIGSGANAALGWLHANDKFRYEDDVVHIAHRLVEAKFCAETSRAVGSRTVIAVMFSDGIVTGAPLFAESVRKTWDAGRNQEPRREVLEAIDSALQEYLRIQNTPKQLLSPPDPQQKEDPAS